MDYNHKDAIHFCSTQSLQNLYDRNMHNRNMYHHRDDKGRAIWSFDELLWMLHYYLFDKDGTIIETGVAHMSPGLLKQFTDTMHLPASQVTSFILNHPVAYTIRRKHPQPVVAAPVDPAKLQPEVIPAEIPAYADAKPVDKAAKTKPAHNTRALPPQVSLSMLTSYTIPLQPAASFADRAITAAFAGCDLQEDDTQEQQHYENTGKYCPVALIYMLMRYASARKNPSLSLMQASPGHSPPVPGISS